MHFLFLVCITGIILVLPLHFLSVEHLKLQIKYGRERGTKIGEYLGFISGWGFFLFLIGTWISPQPRFYIPILHNFSVSLPVINLLVSFLHLIISLPSLSLGIWFGIKGVIETTLRVAETHRTEKIVTTGVYSIIRHPQYLGALLVHLGFSFLLSSWYSLIFTPLVIGYIYITSWKEERELIKEFGKEYEDYMGEVPMLIPRLRKKE